MAITATNGSQRQARTHRDRSSLSAAHVYENTSSTPALCPAVSSPGQHPHSDFGQPSTLGLRHGRYRCALGGLIDGEEAHAHLPFFSLEAELGEGRLEEIESEGEGPF